MHFKHKRRGGGPIDDLKMAINNKINSQVLPPAKPIPLKTRVRMLPGPIIPATMGPEVSSKMPSPKGLENFGYSKLILDPIMRGRQPNKYNVPQGKYANDAYVANLKRVAVEKALGPSAYSHQINQPKRPSGPKDNSIFEATLRRRNDPNAMFGRPSLWSRSKNFFRGLFNRVRGYFSKSGKGRRKVKRLSRHRM